MHGLYETAGARQFLEQRRGHLLRPDAKELPDVLHQAQGSAYLVPVQWRGTANIIVHLPAAFPVSPPLVFLTANDIRPHVLPHVNSDGQICTLPVGCIINPYRPQEQIESVLHSMAP
jgi:hypothetical protein